MLDIKTLVLYICLTGMNMEKIKVSARQAAVYGLAVVGFITLVMLGASLAVYMTRFAPRMADRIGAAAVSLSEIFVPASPTLSVVPTTPPVLLFGTPTITVPTPTPEPKKPAVSVPKAGDKTTGTYQIGGTAAPVLTGLPDLTVTIGAVGYLATSSAESFIATSTVPSGSRPAVTFTIKNVGSNATGPWRFSASIPAQTAYIYQSQLQQSLNPGDSIDYTLGFDQANAGYDRMISISANFDRAIAESNTDNNNASTKVTVIGS